MPFIKNAILWRTRKLQALDLSCAAILEKDNAVADFRTLIGATDPSEAAKVLFVVNLQKAKLRMPFTVLTLMKMLLSKATSFSLPRKILICKIIISTKL